MPALERRDHLGPAYDLRKVRRADLFFSFGHQHKIDRHFAPRAPNRVQSRQESGFGTFLIDRPASHDNLADPGLVHQRSVPRRRRPLRGVDLFYVVHEIDAERLRGPGIERRKDARLPVGGNLADGLEAGITEHLHGEFAAFVDLAVLSGDRGLANPGLQAFHSLVVTFSDLFENRVQVGWSSR